MQTVWIVTAVQDYEGEDTIGVFASRSSAEQAAAAHIKANHEYASGWPDSEDDRQIRWRIGDMYTITATAHDVKP